MQTRTTPKFLIISEAPLAQGTCVTAPYITFMQGYIFPTEWMRKLLRFIRCKRRPTNRYKHILASIPPQWPPIAPTNSIN